MLGVLLIIIGSAIAMIGLYHANRAKPNQSRGLFGLSRTGTVLVVLSLVGLVAGIAEEIRNNATQQQRLVATQHQNEEMRRKLAELQQTSQFTGTTTEHISAALNRERPRVGELRIEESAEPVRRSAIVFPPDTPVSSGLSSIVVGDSWVPEWFSRWPWYRHRISFKDAPSEPMTVRFEDLLTLDLEYELKGEIADDNQFRLYIEKYPQAPTAFLQVGIKGQDSQYYPVHQSRRFQTHVDGSFSEILQSKGWIRIDRLPPSGDVSEEREIYLLTPGENVSLQKREHIRSLISFTIVRVNCREWLTMR